LEGESFGEGVNHSANLRVLGQEFRGGKKGKEFSGIDGQVVTGQLREKCKKKEEEPPGISEGRRERAVSESHLC